ncbi:MULTISPECIES: transposase [Streptomyces violaceusniger group]|uniref:transposase n=1 Tax=Streptomyces violaceusniger group TaxID=2839105 RepID=UPI000A388C89
MGAPPALVVVDAGDGVTRLSFLLAGLPVDLLGRICSDRVLYFPPPPPPQPARHGRKPKRGAELKFEDPASLTHPITTTTDTTHYGKAAATAWDRLPGCSSGARPGPTTPKHHCRLSKAPSSDSKSTISVATAPQASVAVVVARRSTAGDVDRVPFGNSSFPVRRRICTR